MPLSLLFVGFDLHQVNSQGYFALGYASRRVPEIADRFVDIDNAVKWGFAHEMGPFEIWDALGVKDSIEPIEEQGYEVADWVKKMVKKHDTFYQYQDGRRIGYYDLEANKYLPLEIDDSPFLSMLDAGDMSVEG